MPRNTDHQALVYACSGCSNAAQLANHLAVRLDRDGIAEMSCIAGIGGRVPSLIRKAEAAASCGRKIVAIDGCALSCAKASLTQLGIATQLHVQLATLGVRKAYRTDFDPNQARDLLQDLTRQLQAVDTDDS
ncbi:MAG: putative zinc-binding protein [Aquabacterium sp.]|uniref:putative zinc-binding protein n=1 Tax=Aquabacterium sp. TaxID=1872578 RepID=UPI0025C6559D|nr:putative zinc-binding protein [Aquabacterium sp.]MBI5927123.1 putative zinc-binding protein [Aquabacterium sp.]